VDGVRQKTTETISYEVATGRPILVPSMEYLKTAAGASERNAKTGK
jgi:hypothetical protein